MDERRPPPPLPAAVVRRQVRLPLHLGNGGVVEARIFTFDGLCDGREHVALGLGDRANGAGAETVPLVRLHSECLTGDVFGSQRCDCGPQLREAVERISDAGGYLLYLRQEGRGIGLYNKIDAYALQDTGLDTYEANLALGFGEDERTYAVAAQILLALGVGELDLLSNNPDKAEQLRAGGVRVSSRVPTAVHLSPVNGRYLVAKACKGHDGLDRCRVPPPLLRPPSTFRRSSDEATQAARNDERVGDDPGLRLSVLATSLEEAKAKVIAEYGEAHVISLRNEDDEARPR